MEQFRSRVNGAYVYYHELENGVYKLELDSEQPSKYFEMTIIL